MNQYFKTLLLSAILLSVDARFFRGGNAVLKGSADFARTAGSSNIDHTTYGDVEHAATASGRTTDQHITSEIAINLAQKIPSYIARVRSILETQVDTGVTFCGNPYKRTSGAKSGKYLSELTGTAFSVNHAYSDSAVANDGIVASSAEISITDEIAQCGKTNCISGSIVHSVAQFIRSQGFHVNHDDICRARGTVVDVNSQTCNLDVTPSVVRQFNCKRKTGFSDQWKYDRQCKHFGVDNRRNVDGTTNAGYSTSTGGSKCDSNALCEENDDDCIYKPSLLLALDSNTLCVEDFDNAIVPQPQTYSSGGTVGTAYKNQLKRVLKYGLITGSKADIEDSTIVTGADNGCTSLRAIVLAINGNKLAAKYVAKQHNYAETYWKGQIDDSRSIINTVREKIINLQGLGDFFYPLEKSKPFQCGAEFSAFESGIDEGSATNPKCDLAGTSYASTQGVPHTKSMGQRSTCFCRSFADSGDDFYLTTTAANSSDCDTKFKGKLPSVYTYCRKHGELGRTVEWKNTLDQLKFSASDVPTLLDTWFVGASTEIQQNFDASIVGQGTKCGRVASASTNSVAFSNKGGNCIPLEGIEQIVYRLEFEFFSPDAAVDRKGSGATYADMMCEANVAGDQVLSFRQLVYQWQNNATMVEEDANPDTIATTNPTSQFYDNAGTLINGVLVPQYKTFVPSTTHKCWGVVERTWIVASPLRTHSNS